jgi:hypothetical protein
MFYTNFEVTPDSGSRVETLGWLEADDPDRAGDSDFVSVFLALGRLSPVLRAHRPQPWNLPPPLGRRANSPSGSRVAPRRVPGHALAEPLSQFLLILMSEVWQVMRFDDLGYWHQYYVNLPPALVKEKNQLRRKRKSKSAHAKDRDEL